MTDTTTTRDTAIENLINGWNKTIENGKHMAGLEGIDDDMFQSMISQIRKDEQGYDMSAEDFNDEMPAIMGWENLDGHEDEWMGIVEDACARFIVETLAARNPEDVQHDLNGLKESIDRAETIYTGNLADDLVDAFGGLNEETDAILSTAIIEFFDRLEASK